MLKYRMVFTGMALATVLGVTSLAAPRPAAAIDSEVEAHMVWASGDSGAPDCPQEYIGTYPVCLVSGNRSCLMREARARVRDGDYDMAFRLVLATQCHNAGAQQKIAAAGRQAVCE